MDSGVIEGDIISVYYDPMIAKLIVWGEDRDTALSCFLKALSQVQVVGVQTNVPLLLAVAQHPAFSAAKLNTHFIEQYQHDLFAKPPVTSKNLVALVMLATGWYRKNQAKCWQENTNDQYSPWFAGDSWRCNTPPRESITLYENETHYTAFIDTQSETSSSLMLENTVLVVNHFKVLLKDNRSDNASHAYEFSASINEELQIATIVFYPPLIHVFNQRGYHLFSMPHLIGKKEDTDSAQHVVAPMPGTITEIFVSKDQAIKKGDRLLVVEAMKMQHTLYASMDGRIKDIFFKAGNLVMEGAKLVEIE